MSNKKTHIVVVDEGSSQCKVAWTEKNKIVTKVISSKVGMGRGMLSEDPLVALQIGNYEFHATNGEGLPSNTEAYQTSPHIVFATHNALIESGFAGKDVHLCVTLPIASYFSISERSGQAKNEALIKLKEDNLLKLTPTSFNKNTKVANIVSVSVHCESKPAFISAMFDKDLNPTFEYNETDTYVVIDVGDTTTDIAQFDGKGKLTRGGFASLENGVSHLRNELNSELTAKHGRITTLVTANTLRTGSARIGGESHDEKKLVAMLKDNHFFKLQHEIVQALADANTVAKFCIVGGGAEVYAKQFKAWSPKVVIAKNHETALAEGILRLEQLRLEDSK